MEGFLRYEFEGLIFGGAYKWRGLLSEFYGIASITVAGIPEFMTRRSMLTVTVAQTRQNI